jgi:hypothetical protein
MPPQKKPHTHTAWGVAQIGRRHRQLLEVGTGTIDYERKMAVVYTNRIVRRDTGTIILVPHDEQPPTLQPHARRPGDEDSIDADEGDGEA